MARRRAVFLLLAAASPALTGCSPPPAGLLIGDCEIPSADLAAAEAELARSFLNEGEGSRRWHLLEFGMGEAALLHHALPDQSAAARELAEAAAGRLAAADDVAAEVRAVLTEIGLGGLDPAPLQPYPSALGARVAAAVAALEPGGWAGPLRTRDGWTLVYLEQRMEGPRNRANVLVYEMDFPVGDARDREQAREDWATLPLDGDPELLDALPIEFRRGRVRDTP